MRWRMEVDYGPPKQVRVVTCCRMTYDSSLTCIEFEQDADGRRVYSNVIMPAGADYLVLYRNGRNADPLGMLRPFEADSLKVFRSQFNGKDLLRPFQLELDQVHDQNPSAQPKGSIQTHEGERSKSGARIRA